MNMNHKIYFMLGSFILLMGGCSESSNVSGGSLEDQNAGISDTILSSSGNVLNSSSSTSDVPHSDNGSNNSGNEYSDICIDEIDGMEIPCGPTPHCRDDHDIGEKDSTSWLICEESGWRPITIEEEVIGKVCSSPFEGDTATLFGKTLVCKDGKWNGEVVYDSITDSRDGQVYRTIEIGSQVWMAENLNYDVSAFEKEDTVTTFSWCYGGDEENCLKYGRLYSWYAIMDSVYPGGNICPEGFHVPSRQEYEVLFEFVGGKDYAGYFLKASGKWPTDEASEIIGFDLLPGGVGFAMDIFQDVGFYAYLWTSSERPKNGSDLENGFAEDIMFENGNPAIFWGKSGGEKYVGNSLRCIKN